MVNWVMPSEVQLIPGYTQTAWPYDYPDLPKCKLLSSYCFVCSWNPHLFPQNWAYRDHLSVIDELATIWYAFTIDILLLVWELHIRVYHGCHAEEKGLLKKLPSYDRLRRP